MPRRTSIRVMYEAIELYKKGKGLNEAGMPKKRKVTCSGRQWKQPESTLKVGQKSIELFCGMCLILREEFADIRNRQERSQAHKTAITVKRLYMVCVCSGVSNSVAREGGNWCGQVCNWREYSCIWSLGAWIRTKESSSVQSLSKADKRSGHFFTTERLTTNLTDGNRTFAERGR